MMEEVNDDTNGESTFEFVEGKTDETSKEPVSSSSQSPSVTSANPTASATTGLPISSTVASSVGGLFPASTPGSFLTSVSPLANPASPQILSTTVTTAPPPIPMYNPIQQPGISGSFSPLLKPASPGYGLMSPISVEPTTSYMAPNQNYIPQAASSGPVGIPQAALELPVDDGYVSSSGQPFQGTSEKGVWGWIKGNEFLHRVAEKAKSSVDSVITTLDPGMREIIHSGGDINIVVASNSEAKVSAVREAFQLVFNKATVVGIPSQSTSIAPQPVGFSAGLKAAEERISNLRQQGLIPEHQVVVAVENFLAEFTPEKWYDLGCIMLQDPTQGMTLQVYSQAIPVATHFVMQAKEQTSPDYPLGWSGFAVTIGQVLGSAMGVHHSLWHQALTGVSRRDMLFLASKSLAGLYKSQLRR